MGLMDSIEVQYIWKAIQESERSDENLCSNPTLSDRLFQACQSASSFPALYAGDVLGDRAAQPEADIRRELEHGDGKNLGQDQMPLSRPKGRLFDG